MNINSSRKSLRITAALLVGSLIAAIALSASAFASNEQDSSLEASVDEETVETEDESEVDDDPDTDGCPDEPLADDGTTLTRNQLMTLSDDEESVMDTSSGYLTKSTCVEFASYTSPRWYCNRYYTDGSHKTGHYFYSGTIAYHKMNGEYVYCIEPNTGSSNGTYYTGYYDSAANSTTYWEYELDSTQRSYIKQILAFGYPEVDRGYSVQVQYAATQTLIWEVCARLRYSNGLQSISDNGLYKNIYAKLGANYQACYNAILSDISTLMSKGQVPSFAGASTAKAVNLIYNANTKCYEASVTDSNSVLSYFTFTYTGVTFTKSGNTLKISVPEASIASVTGKTITGTSTQKLVSESDPVIWENSTYQTVIAKGGAESPKAYISLTYTPAVSTLKLVKKVTDSSITLKNWEFTIKNNSTGATVTRKTDASGNITVSDLAPGQYTITEKSYKGYATVSSQTVTLTAGKTSTVTFTNSALKGNLIISKGVNYGTLEGFTFRLYGTSTIGRKVDMTATTDSTGVATFSNVYVGTYTLEETDPGDAYLDPSTQTVTVEANSTGLAITKQVDFDNTWKYWYATVTKVDAETGTKQGAATLDGAQYTLYKDGTKVATYTVKNGTFTTGKFPCTANDSVYTLKETKAPTGYTLDSTVYKLTTSYTHYTAASNKITLTVQDTVIKGKVKLEKYAYNQISDEKQPETGASFYIWLNSYTSYSKALDTARDTITIGEDGTGTSKDLPYGTYSLKQATGRNGYDLDETVYTVKISKNGTTITKDTSGNALIFNNQIWTGRLEILKVDSVTKQPLANAQFTLTGSDGSKQTFATGGDGKVFFEDLVYGVTYTWKETQAPHGYLLDEKNTGTWTVSKHDDSITITCEDQPRSGTINASKQDAYGTKLSGATFLLEYWNGTSWVPVNQVSSLTEGGCTSEGLKNGCLTTDDSGMVTFEGLWADETLQYRLTEISAPEGYSLPEKSVYEGTLPVTYAHGKVSAEPDETVGDTDYFYTAPFTVVDGRIYTLPDTGGHDTLLIFAGIMLFLIGSGTIIHLKYPCFFGNLKRLVFNKMLSRKWKA